MKWLVPLAFEGTTGKSYITQHCKDIEAKHTWIAGNPSGVCGWCLQWGRGSQDSSWFPWAAHTGKSNRRTLNSRAEKGNETKIQAGSG